MVLEILKEKVVRNLPSFNYFESIKIDNKNFKRKLNSNNVCYDFDKRKGILLLMRER